MSKTINLHINSDTDRTISDTTTSKWTTYLSTPISISSTSKAILSVQSIEIPNVLYNFGLYDSIFWFYVPSTTTLVGSQIDTSRVFIDGSEFATYMNNLLTPQNIAFTFSTSTNKLTITNNRASAIIIPQSYRYGDTTFNNAYNSCIDKIGFTQELNSVTINPAGSVTAQSMLRLLRTNCYYLTCDAVASSSMQSVIPSPYKSGSNDIVARVTAGNFGSLSQLSYLTGTNIQIQSETLSRLSFQLLDDNFYPINDMYLPITMTLKIEIF